MLNCLKLFCDAVSATSAFNLKLCHNFWTYKAIFKSFRSLNVLKQRKIVYLKTACIWFCGGKKPGEEEDHSVGDLQRFLYDSLSMGVKDIFKSRQLSSKWFFQNCCQSIIKLIMWPKIFFKTIVESIIFQTNFLRQLSTQMCATKFSLKKLSSQLFVKKIFHIFLSIMVIFRLILVNNG